MIKKSQDRIKMLSQRLRLYWPMIKSLQTGLLLVTGITGYVSAKCPVFNMPHILALSVSLFLSIGGSTVLNMVLDRDIDQQMKRTWRRPLPSGRLSVREAAAAGVLLSVTGIISAFFLLPLFGWVVLSGWLLDVMVYTFWLKRRTAWSILWGGLSGGMPVLAGRVLGTGQIDGIGLLLAAAVVLWIPTHIMTFNIRHQQDYASAGVPTFPSIYGVRMTRLTIAFSAVGTALAFVLGAFALGLAWGYLRFLMILTAGITGLAVYSLFKPTERSNLILFRYASVYMLGAMLLILMGTGFMV